MIVVFTVTEWYAVEADTMQEGIEQACELAGRDEHEVMEIHSTIETFAEDFNMIIIEVEGGIVQAVINVPKGMTVVVNDHDQEAIGEENLISIHSEVNAGNVEAGAECTCEHGIYLSHHPDFEESEGPCKECCPEWWEAKKEEEEDLEPWEVTCPHGYTYATCNTCAAIQSGCDRYHAWREG